MLRDHASSQRLSAAVIRLQTRIAVAGMPVCGSYERTIFFLLVLRRCLGTGGDAPCRSISMLAIATSLGRPYATVWRRLQSMATDGFLVVEARSVVIAPGIVDHPAVDGLLSSVKAGFQAMLDALVHSDVVQAADAPLAPDQRLVGAIDLLLCTIESACRTDWVDLLLIGYIEHCRVDIDGTREDDAPGTARLNVRQMAHDLGLPYSTVHRRACAMIDAGTLERCGRSVTVARHWLDEGPGVIRTATAIDCARRVLQRLGFSCAG